jgi:DNA-binding HxlR family transcriptional regulator
MTSTIESLHKILKDETRRKIVLLLEEKGNFGYTDLMDNLNIVSTGTLNYHLKVLGDFIDKDPNGEYRLTEKGKIAYRILTEFPDQERPLQDKRIYKSWIILTVASIIIAALNGYFLNIPIERTATVIAVLLLLTGFAFYIRIRPSTSGNRALFIATGAFVIGFLFWAIIVLSMNASGLRWQIVSLSGNVGDDFFALTSLIICWIAGGLVGEWIGKKRNYILPSLRV